jgi:uncharacterized protein YprB with RNaseH-like and TPR domain
MNRQRCTSIPKVPRVSDTAGDQLTLIEKSQERYDLYHQSIADFLQNHPERTPEWVEDTIRNDAKNNDTRTKPTSKRFLYWDLETTGLDPTKNSLLCANVTSGAGDKMTLSRLNFPDDESDVGLAVAVRSTLEFGATIAGYNSKGFDLPFLNERLRRAGQRPLKIKKHVDIMLMVPRSWPKRSLDYVSRRLGLQDETAKKTPFDETTWYKASRGDVEAMDYIVSHNVDDVELTRRVYLRFLEMRGQQDDAQ